MKIVDLTIDNLRLIEHLQFSPKAGINVISGNNGAGKTTVLEAIYLAGRGRSFRHNDAKPLIREGDQEARVVAKVERLPEGNVTTLGLARDKDQLLCRRDGQEVRRRSELAETLPVQWISSQPQLFLELGPDLRRRFLDMAVFHVEHDYLKTLGGFQRTLKQRNAALRSGNRSASQAWDMTLAEASEAIDTARRTVLSKIIGKAQPILDTWPIGGNLQIHYQRGWAQDVDLLEVLKKRVDDDLHRGYTGRGPHRAELDVVVSAGDRTHQAAKVLSRGQLKLLVIALNLAVSDVISMSSDGERPVWLLDDLPAELDRSNRARVMRELSDRRCQAFITRLADEDLPLQEIEALFHVEHGQLG